MIKRFFTLLLLLTMIGSCTVYRELRYWTPGIDEYNAFPQAKIKSGDEKFHFPIAIDSSIVNTKVKKIVQGDMLWYSVDEYLAPRDATAYLIIKNDTLVFEKYYHGYDRSKISTFFSVTKSVTSLLIGIAVDEGYIKSVHDLVIDYIPELKKGDQRFHKLTIEHLLNMQAGLHFTESYSNPFKHMARLLYGRNSLGYLKRLKFEQDPGEKYVYNSATTAILGIVLERAIKRPYAEYLEEKVWKPLGMENNASISLDDKKHRVAKSYQGLNATAIDLAKIGRLYMNGGNWNGKQIVSKGWIDKSITPNIEEGHIGIKYRGHQYHWYSDGRTLRDSTGTLRFNDSLSALRFAEESAVNYYKVWKFEKEDKSGWYWTVVNYPPQFYAFGIYGQVLWVDPEKKLIMVRLGKYAYHDYNVVNLTQLLTQKYPILEKKW